MKVFSRIIAALVLVLFIMIFDGTSVQAKDFWHYGENSANGCRDVEIVFARGSGQPHEIGDTFLEFKKDMELAAKQAGLSYRVTDIDYDAVAISAGNVLGVYASAGEAYSFGKSVDGGVAELRRYVQKRSVCPNTYWVLGGYSQGAMVIANTLDAFDENRLVYIMLFGDPKLYLPEGEGFNPPACRGEWTSNYRVYVPNCNTDNGILGARKPYELERFAGRYGLWCETRDFICGSSKNPLVTDGHMQYEEHGLVKMASGYALRRMKYLRKHAQLMGIDNYMSRSVDFSLAESSESSDEGLPSVWAQLTENEYRAKPGSELIFDSSPSFDIDGDELSYSWYFNGDLQDETGATLTHYFKSPGIYSVQVVVTNSAGESSEASATIYIMNTDFDNSLPTPVNVLVERCGERRICLHWTRMRNQARYLAVRVNDYFLGYADISNNELVIDDIDFRDAEVAVSFMDSNQNLGSFSVLEIEGVEPEIVATSASLPWWRIGAIAGLPFGFLALARVILKLIKDLKKMKNAQEF